MWYRVMFHVQKASDLGHGVVCSQSFSVCSSALIPSDQICSAIGCNWYVQRFGRAEGISGGRWELWKVISVGSLVSMMLS